MRYIVALFCLLIPLQAVAQSIGSKEKALMTQIVVNCLEIPTLKLPRPEADVDRDLQNFKDHERWFKRDLSQLRAMAPGAERLSLTIHGKAFNEHVAHCKKKISRTEANLKKEAAITPNDKAQAKINDALWQCRIIEKWIINPKKYNANYNSIFIFSKSYIKARDEALVLDKRIASWRGKEIEKCNQVVLPKYNALKEKRRKQDVARKAAAKAEQQEKQREFEVSQRRFLAAYNAKKKTATLFGYKGFYQGITNLIDDLNRGSSTIEKAKSFLIEPYDQDDFSVANITDDYVIYGYSKQSSSEFIQIAVVREAGKYYGDGAPLANGFYAVKGVAEFVTALGAKKQLIILKKVSE